MVRAVRARGIAAAVFTTVNNYDTWLEPFVPPLKENVAGLEQLSGIVGAERVWWRFDPVVPTNVQSLGWFKSHLSTLCEKLRGTTSRCITSIVNTEGPAKYRHCAANINRAGKRVGQELVRLRRGEKLRWLGELSSVVHDIMGFPLEVCCHPFLSNPSVDPKQRKAEPQHLLSASDLEIVQRFPHLAVGQCIHGAVLSRLGVRGNRRDGTHSLGSKRKGDIRYDLGMCQCRRSTDIGGDVPCPHGCVYCQWPHSSMEQLEVVQIDASQPSLTPM
jgi:hypothetical protein